MNVQEPKFIVFFLADIEVSKEGDSENSCKSLNLLSISRIVISIFP